eukprot:IDg17011t1
MCSVIAGQRIHAFESTSSMMDILHPRAAHPQPPPLVSCPFFILAVHFIIPVLSMFFTRLCDHIAGADIIHACAKLVMKRVPLQCACSAEPPSAL